MPVTIGQKPVKVGNIFACRKPVDFGAEADVFTIACNPDVVLKIYRQDCLDDVKLYYNTFDRLSKIGLATKVYGGVIIFDENVTKGLCYERNKYGFLCEKVEVKTCKSFDIHEHYRKYRKDVHLLRDTVNDLMGRKWGDDSDYNVGVNKDGDVVCIDMGGIAIDW